MRRKQCTASAVASLAKRLGSGATKIRRTEPGHTRLKAESRLQVSLRDCSCVLALAVACAFPLSSFAEDHSRGEPPAATGRWVWAAPDQTRLRILALDSTRQQVVAKVGDGKIMVLNNGEQIPSLAIRLSAVSVNTAVFQPSSGPGSEAIERIAITLDRNGGQLTSTFSLSAPRQGVMGGWLASPR